MRKRNLLLLIITTFWTAANIQSQVIVVKTCNGERNVRELNLLQKFSFLNGNLLLTLKDNSTDSYNLTDINKLYFRSDASLIYNDTVAFDGDTIENIFTISPILINGKTAGRVYVFPNPARSVIQLENLPSGKSPISILRIEGALVLNTVVSSESNTINISNLRKGLYILKINSQALKFIKL
jgi:hypothetical protein